MKLQYIFLILFQALFFSCKETSISSKNNSTKTIEKNPSESIFQCSSDTSIQNYDWGKSEIHSLGIIKNSSEKYHAKTLFLKIRTANGEKGRSFLLLEKGNGDTFCYEAKTPESLPDCVINERLYYSSKSCIEEELEITEEILCLNCSKNGCFLREENPINQ